MKKYIDPEKLPQLFREGTDENGDALVSLSEVRKALSLATVDPYARKDEPRAAPVFYGKPQFLELCKYCGKPVTKKGFMHKLDDGSEALVHHVCHLKMHEKREEERKQ